MKINHFVAQMTLPAQANIPAYNKRPTTFRHYIIKVASRCNLDCTYCYEYRHADQTWRLQPRQITSEVAYQAARRIAEHVERHQILSIHLSLHGGEPLLLGKQVFTNLLDIFEAEISPCCSLTKSVQTNGTFLDKEWLDLFVEREVLVNVSLDGPPEVNDSHRVDHRGRGSYMQTARGLSLLTERAREIFAGIYAVIDVGADPVETVDHLMQWEPSAIDLLIPDAHWSMPPVRPSRASGVDYGEWMAAVFDAWFIERRWGPVLIYTFDELLKLLLGGSGRLDTFGLVPFGLIAVAADGSLHALDTLKITFEGASSLNANVFTHALDDVADHVLIRTFQDRWSSLCSTCRACPWVQVCGGGYYPHRYLKGEGFVRPSVYCEDIQYLLSHMSRRVQSDPAFKTGGGETR